MSLAYGQRADAAAATVLRRLLDTVHANMEGALAGEDPEYLHQLRISVRRSRTVQRQLAPVFPPLELPGYRTEFNWLQRVTGEARDLDVYVEEFDAMLDAGAGRRSARDLDPLRPVLDPLAAGRPRRDGPGAAVAPRRRAAVGLGPAARGPAGALARGPAVGRRADRRAGRAADPPRVPASGAKLGRRIDEASPAEDYHELRKKGKELRYLLELFGMPLYPSDVVEPLVRSLKGLQDVLGRHQDREVQVAMLRSLAGEVATLRRGPKALMAMGILIDRLQADEAAARAEFAERFAVLADVEQRRLVKSTFGPSGN